MIIVGLQSSVSPRLGILEEVLTALPGTGLEEGEMDDLSGIVRRSATVLSLG